VAGEVELPGGPLVDEELVFAFHVVPMEHAPRPYLGHLMLVTRRHAPGFEDLRDDEAAAVGIGVARLARALREEGASEVYVARIGRHVPHLHVHVLPRWPETPPEVKWYEVDEWDGARRGGADEIAEYVESLRHRL
jgi:histidine triad (HIT) family protein